MNRTAGHTERLAPDAGLSFVTAPLHTRLEIRRRILKGFGANVFGQIVIAVVQLVGVPILLNAWGTRLYGEWLVLFAIPSFLSITDLGFSQSAANDMSQKVARGEHGDANVVFQSLCALVYGAAAAGMLTVTALLFFLPLRHWTHLSAIPSEAVRWILLLLSLEIFVRLTDGINHAGYRASGDYAFHATIYYITLLCQYASIWLVASLGYGPVLAAFAYLMVRCVVTPVVALVLVRRHRWLKIGFVHASRPELRRLASPALANLSMPLAQALNIQGMVVVVGAVLGPIAVVVFSTLRTLTRLALQMVLVVGNAAEPEFAAAFGRQDQRLLRTLFVHALRAGLWLAVTAAACLLFVGKFILDHWTHGKVPMDVRLFDFLLASAVASVLWYSALVLLKAANLHLRASLLYSVSAATVVAFAAVILSLTGRLSDAGLALLLMDAVMGLYTLRAASRIVGLTTADSLAQAVNPFPIIRVALRKANAT